MNLPFRNPIDGAIAGTLVVLTLPTVEALWSQDFSWWAGPRWFYSAALGAFIGVSWSVLNRPSGSCD